MVIVPYLAAGDLDRSGLHIGIGRADICDQIFFSGVFIIPATRQTDDVDTIILPQRSEHIFINCNGFRLSTCIASGINRSIQQRIVFRLCDALLISILNRIAIDSGLFDVVKILRTGRRINQQVFKCIAC